MMKIMLFLIMLNLNIIYNSSKFIIMLIINLLLIFMFLFINLNMSSMDWFQIYNFLGMDFISYSLSLLSILIIIFMLMSSMFIMYKKLFTLMLIQLLTILILSFMSMNYFLFYIFFEISLIPTFMLIIGWGYQPERINASMYMMIYTLFASLPLLIFMFILNKIYLSMNYLIILNYIKFEFNLNNLMFYLFMIMAFMMKLPLFMFHMWLPKAHIEAPVAGSMILAGVMLKLGGYGIMRSMLIMMNLSLNFNYLMMSISLIGMIFLSLVCLRQYDMKLIVAYSSVVHMGMMLLGMMTMTMWGMLGSLMLMIGHGICSPAMFYLVNLNYERTHSRNMMINKGLINFMPSLSMWWFMFCIINMSAPVSLNLLSELMIASVLLNWAFNIIIILMIGMFTSAIYSLFLFSYTQHGNFEMNLFKIHNIKINEYLLLMLHWIPLNIMILKIDFLI